MSSQNSVPLSPMSRRTDTRNQQMSDTRASVQDDTQSPAAAPLLPQAAELDDETHPGDARRAALQDELDLAPPSFGAVRRRQGIIGLLPPKLAAFAENNVGLLFAAAAQMFFTFMGVTVRYFLSTTDISTLTLIVIRMSITCSLCIIVMHLLGVAHPVLGPPELRRLLAARGTFGFCGLFAAYQCLRYLTNSDSTTIHFLTPTTTALVGWLYLGESLLWQEIAGGALSLLGVLCVSRPPFLFGSPTAASDASTGHGDTDSSRGVGLAWAMASISSATMAYITIRKIGKRAHALHSMTYFAGLCTIICSIALLIVPGPFVFVSTVRDFALIIIIGVFGFVAQMLLTMGLQREKAGRATMASYLGLFYSMILEFFVFDIIPPFLSILGAVIIISSAVWVALSKPQAKPVADPVIEDEESARFDARSSPRTVNAPRSLVGAQQHSYGRSSGENGHAAEPLLGVRLSDDQERLEVRGIPLSADRTKQKNALGLSGTLTGSGGAIKAPALAGRRRGSAMSISSSASGPQSSP